MVGPIAEVTELLANVAREQAKFDQARTLFDRSRAMYQQLGWTRAETLIRFRLAILAADTGDLVKASDFYSEVLAELRADGWTWGLATVLIGAGWLSLVQEQPSSAATSFREALALFHTIGNPLGEATAVRAIGALAAHTGHARAGARLLGASEAKREIHGFGLLPSEQRQDIQARSLATATLGNDVFASMCAEGRALCWESAIGEARVLAHDLAATTGG
jgi:hypothetical protein